MTQRGITRAIALLGLWAIGACQSAAADGANGANDDGGPAIESDAGTNDATVPSETTDASTPDTGTTADASVTDATLVDATLSDANADASDASTPDTAPPQCTQVDRDDVAAASATLQTAFAPALGMGLVFEPSLETLLAREATIDDAIDKLEATCEPGEVAALRSDVASLAADVGTWLATPPAGFSSVPPTFVRAGDVVDVVAHVAGDPAGTTFSVVAGPSGMTVDPTTGRVQFAPTLGDKGAHTVTLKGAYGSVVALQTFPLTVSERTVRLSQSVSPASAATLTINAPGTSLDGAKVLVPAGAVDAADTMVLAELDPPPPSSSPGRILGSALEVTLASGSKHFNAPLEIVLPAPGLGSGETASLVSWAAGTPGFGHPIDGTYAFTDVSGVPAATGTASGTATQAGTTATVATKGEPLRASSGGFRFVADPSVSNATLQLFVGSIEDAHDFIVTQRQYLDPTANGAKVTVAIRKRLDRDALGLAPDQQNVVLSAAAVRLPLRDNVAAHELFHVEQFYTPPKKGHGALEYVGGARWWMEATAELIGQDFAQVNGSLLFDATGLVSRSVTSYRPGTLDQYNAALFFDFLVTRYNFDMKGFWETIPSQDLMASDGAEKVLAARASLDVDGIPYLPFVRAYGADRSAQNFSHVAVAAAAPLFPLMNMPDAEGDYAVVSDEPLTFLSSRSYVVTLPAGTADNMFYATLTGPSTTAAWIYDKNSGASLAKLKGTSGEQTLGPIAGKSLAVHIANLGTQASFDTSVSFKLRMKNVPVTVPPVEVWYLLGIFQYNATPLGACQAWVSTISGGTNARIVANTTGTCAVGADYCCWYTHPSNPDAGNVGIFKAFDCPTGYTNVSGTCTRQ